MYKNPSMQLRRKLYHAILKPRIPYVRTIILLVGQLTRIEQYLFINFRVPADQPRLNFNENPCVGIHLGVKTSTYGPWFDHTAKMEVRVGCPGHLNTTAGSCQPMKEVVNCERICSCERARSGHKR